MLGQPIMNLKNMLIIEIMELIGIQLIRITEPMGRRKVDTVKLFFSTHRCRNLSHHRKYVIKQLTTVSFSSPTDTSVGSCMSSSTT